MPAHGRELDTRHPTSSRGDFANGAFLSLGNPLNIVFWTGLGTTVFASISESPQPIHFAIFFAGFLGGAVLWCFLHGWTGGLGTQVCYPTFFRWVNLTCGLALGLFALQLGWQLVQTM